MINVDSGLDKERRGGSGFTVDTPFLAGTILLVLIGLATLFSVSRTSADPGLFKKQFMFLILGLIPMAIFALTPIMLWKRISNWLYVGNILLLLGVMFKGESGGGAQRWIDIGPLQFQPSEMTKIICVITLATFFESRKERIKDFSTFLLSLLHILPSLILVVLQPHMGATLTILVTWISICVIARVPWKFLFAFLAAFTAIFIVLLNVPDNPIVRDYHKKRIMSLVVKNEQDPDYKKQMYQQERGQIAFGIGGVTGDGYLKGSFKTARSVPQQHNNFIMTVIGEETGMIGCIVLLLGYGFFFMRGWSLAIRMSDSFSQMCAFGVLTVLAFHMIVNVQMNLAIGPVIGLWLPFISYGGTALWLCLSCVGLLIGLNSQRRQGMFTANPWSDIQK